MSNRCYIDLTKCTCGGFETKRPCPKDANETYGGNIFDDIADMHDEFDHIRRVAYVLDGKDETR